jgi:hypothetical protein
VRLAALAIECPKTNRFHLMSRKGAVPALRNLLIILVWLDSSKLRQNDMLLHQQV